MYPVKPWPGDSGGLAEAFWMKIEIRRQLFMVDMPDQFFFANSQFAKSFFSDRICQKMRILTESVRKIWTAASATVRRWERDASTSTDLWVWALHVGCESAALAGERGPLRRRFRRRQVSDRICQKVAFSDRFCQNNQDSHTGCL